MFKSILAPIDINAEKSGRRCVLEFSASLAKLYTAELHVVSVCPDFGMSIVGMQFDESFKNKAIAEIKSKLDDFVAQNVPSDVQAQTHVAYGSIYDQIVKSADRLSSDAIVLSAHRPELKDYLLGPNAARVVRHAKQSVFVIRD